MSKIIATWLIQERNNKITFIKRKNEIHLNYHIIKLKLKKNHGNTGSRTQNTYTTHTQACTHVTVASPLARGTHPPLHTHTHKSAHTHHNRAK